MNESIVLALSVSINAGSVIMDIYDNKSRNLNTASKSDNSPVTVADLASNEIIVDSLLQTGYHVISEEMDLPSLDVAQQLKCYWLVDPLDGTKEFINRTGEFSVNIAFISDKKPIIGVIYVPYQQKIYFAEQNIGAYVANAEEIKNITNIDEIIKLSKPLPFCHKNDKFIIGQSVSFRDDKTNSYIDQLCKENPNSEIVPLGGALKFAAVASGEMNCYPRRSSISQWDVAAGFAIITASGGTVTDLTTGKPYIFENPVTKTTDFICLSAGSTKIK